MFNKKYLSPSQQILLAQNRESILMYCFLFAVWLAVLLRNSFGSKMPFVTLMASLFIMSCVVTVIAIVLYNYGNFGE